MAVYVTTPGSEWFSRVLIINLEVNVNNPASWSAAKKERGGVAPLVAFVRLGGAQH